MKALTDKSYKKLLDKMQKKGSKFKPTLCDIKRMSRLVNNYGADNVLQQFQKDLM